MEKATEEAIASVFGGELKLEVEKKDRLIKALNAEIKSAHDKVEAIKKELDELSVRKAGLQDESINAYSDKEADLKKRREDFETSVKNSTHALDQREKELEDKE